MDMDFVLKLRELRRLSGLSQKEVALSSGVGEKTLSSFETGERIGSMKLVQLLAILAVYHLTAADFFGAGVETMIFAESERLTATEMQLLRGLRLLPDAVRTRLEAKFLAMIEGVDAASDRKLRAVI